MAKYKIERKSFKQIIGNIFVISGLITMGVSGYKIYKFVDRNNDAITQTTTIEETINDSYEEKNSSTQEEIEKTETEHVNKYNFEELRKINPDIIGIIEGDCFVNGYYPVVSSTSYDDLNEKLYQDLEGEYSSAGLIIADPNNEENLEGITRIWGHHFSTEEDTGLMFSSLVNFNSNEYYENHKNLKYYTEDGEYVLEVFAYTEDNPLDQPIGYQTEEEMSQNINDINQRNLIQTNNKITPDDKIFILTTCTRAGSANEPDIRTSVYTKVNPVWEKTPSHSKSI